MRAADAKGAKAPVGSQPAVTDLIRTSDELYLDFARDDLGHPELPDLPAQLYEELHHCCQQANPPLVCRTYRHPMYLRRDAGRLAARHINPAHEQLNHGKSPEHEACKERILQMAGRRGLIAHEESSRGADGRTHPGRISDVVLHGEKTIGFEAAYTDSALAVTRKFNRGARDGVTVYSRRQLERLAAALEAGPALYGWDQDQRWTGARVATLIGRLFHVRYTVRGATYLLHRLGFSAQVPVHRAAERDETDVEAWRESAWPEIKG